MTAAILSICLACGKEFSHSPTKAGKFCCVACYRAHQRNGEYKRGPEPSTARTPCAHCGAAVVGVLSKKRNGERSDLRFCNRACYDAYRAKIIANRSIDCIHCGAFFSPSAHRAGKYCSDACRIAHRKAKPKLCVNCKCLFTPVKLMPSRNKYVSHNSGKTCSAECQNQWTRNDPERKRKIGIAFSGHLHPNWQGGKSLMNNTSNRGPNWKTQRKAALARDKYMCVDCGITESACIEKFGRSLDVDHIAPFHNFNSYKKANALSNLECRCPSCHKKEESKRGMVQMVLPMQDSVRRQHKGMSGRTSNQKLCAAQVACIRSRHSNGDSLADIHADYPIVGIHAVRAVVQRKTWKSI